jgi:hypothetical protein
LIACGGCQQYLDHRRGGRLLECSAHSRPIPLSSVVAYAAPALERLTGEGEPRAYACRPAGPPYAPRAVPPTLFQRRSGHASGAEPRARSVPSRIDGLLRRCRGRAWRRGYQHNLSREGRHCQHLSNSREPATRWGAAQPYSTGQQSRSGRPPRRLRVPGGTGAPGVVYSTPDGAHARAYSARVCASPPSSLVAVAFTIATPVHATRPCRFTRRVVLMCMCERRTASGHARL